MPVFHVGDVVKVKDDDRTWNIKYLYMTLGSHNYEALLEVSGEAWVRTKRVDVRQLEQLAVQPHIPMPVAMPT